MISSPSDTDQAPLETVQSGAWALNNMEAVSDMGAIKRDLMMLLEREIVFDLCSVSENALQPLAEVNDHRLPQATLPAHTAKAVANPQHA